MNTKLTVKLDADTNDIPVKYGVVEITVGSTAAATYCVLQTIRVGWDTFANYDNWKAHKNIVGDYANLSGRDVTGIQGTLGELTVAALDAISVYDTQTPSFDQ